MSQSRVFVGFSSTDIQQYRLMCAWKAHEHIPLDFTDCQLGTELNSENEQYIKRKCRERIDMAGTYIMLIGDDTRSKHKYVRWEAEIAIEKGCRIIGVNLNRACYVDYNRTPAILKSIGALFIPFSPKVVAYALDNWRMKASQNWTYKPKIYTQLGYRLIETSAGPILTPSLTGLVSGLGRS